jgi:hypothetical protein
MTGVPILRPPPPSVGGGREHALRLTTVDGDEHILCVSFNIPEAGGAADLGALKTFDPKAQLETQVTLTVAFAQRLPVNLPEKFKPSMTFDVEGGAHVMPVHVVSFKYLGPVVGRDPGIVGGADTFLRVRTSRGVATIPIGEPADRLS